MMENIEFRYCFKDDNESREIRDFKKNEEALNVYDVCEMFLDFMKAIGFSEDNIFKYFNAE